MIAHIKSDNLYRSEPNLEIFSIEFNFTLNISFIFNSEQNVNNIGALFLKIIY